MAALTQAWTTVSRGRSNRSSNHDLQKYESTIDEFGYLMGPSAAKNLAKEMGVDVDCVLEAQKFVRGGESCDLSAVKRFAEQWEAARKADTRWSYSPVRPLGNHKFAPEMDEFLRNFIESPENVSADHVTVNPKEGEERQEKFDFSKQTGVFLFEAGGRAPEGRSGTSGALRRTNKEYREEMPRLRKAHANLVGNVNVGDSFGLVSNGADGKKTVIVSSAAPNVRVSRKYRASIPRIFRQRGGELSSKEQRRLFASYETNFQYAVEYNNACESGQEIKDIVMVIKGCGAFGINKEPAANIAAQATARFLASHPDYKVQIVLENDKVLAEEIKRNFGVAVSMHGPLSRRNSVPKLTDLLKRAPVASFRSKYEKDIKKLSENEVGTKYKGGVPSDYNGISADEYFRMQVTSMSSVFRMEDRYDQIRDAFLQKTEVGVHDYQNFLSGDRSSQIYQPLRGFAASLSLATSYMNDKGLLAAAEEANCGKALRKLSSFYERHKDGFVTCCDTAIHKNGFKFDEESVEDFIKFIQRANQLVADVIRSIDWKPSHIEMAQGYLGDNYKKTLLPLFDGSRDKGSTVATH